MTLIDIATHQGDGYIKLPFLANLQRISPGMLDKTLRLLMYSQLLDTCRGRGGGYRVARPMAEISLADVYEAVSGRIVLSPCLESNDCPGCQHKAVWKGVSDLLWVRLQSIKLDGLGEGCLYTKNQKQ